LDDGWLTLGGGKMKLYTNMFPMNMVDLGDKKILIRADQAGTTKGENVVIVDEPKGRLIKPQSLKLGVWKENVGKKASWRIKPTSSMLIEKYLRQRQDG
jgi:hypothetical protein